MNYLEELKKWFEEKFLIHNDKKSEKNLFKQGEIYYVNFGVNIGSEFNYTRPAIIFEKSKLSFWRKNVIVIPITSFKKDKKYNGFDYFLKKSELNNLKENSIVKILHVRDVSKSRVKTKIGQLSSQELSEIIEIFQKIYK